MIEEKPLDRFRQRALALASRMRFDPFLVNEALSVLTCSFGTEWVVSEAVTQRRGTPWPDRDHPVGKMIYVAGETQVAAALELAHYLKSAAHSRAFPTVVAQIKAKDQAQYKHALLQLAFHHRFALIADQPPILEPPVEGGRVSDIQFHRSGRLYQVECYAPGVRTRTLDEVRWLTAKTIRVIEDLEGVFSIAIQLHSLPAPAERKALHRRIVAVAKQLDRAEWRGATRPPSEMIESELARVSVSRTLPSRPGGRAWLSLHPSFPDLGNAHQFIAASKVPAAAVARFDPTTTNAARRDHIAVWLPPGHAGLPEVVDEQVLGLVRKLRQKLVQTRLGNAYRVLVVDTWTAGSRFRLSEEAQAQVEEALLGAHSHVAGVLLVTRHFDEQVKRHRYRMRPLVNVVLGRSPIVDLHALEATLRVPEALP